ncbi:hypothetical protein LRS05_16850 [Flavobacterium sp. J372]|nr:hypothetical protein [Flavobacterium sp. J372]
MATATKPRLGMYENVKNQFEKAAYVMGLDESVKKFFQLLIMKLLYTSR